MREQFERFKNFLGPYDYQAGFIYSTILVFNLSNLRTYTFDYAYGIERIRFFLLGILTYVILGLPLYLVLRLSQVVWGARKKTLGIYLFELLIASLITLIAQIVGQREIIPRIKTVNFLHGGLFIGEFITRWMFAIIFVAITHNRLRILSQKLDVASALNSELSDRYSKLIESDEEIRSHAAQLLHDRIQAKLMLVGAKLTRVSGVISEEGKIGIQPVIKELESIRSIDVRQVSQLLSPNLSGEGLVGSCENLCKEFEGNIDFTIKIDPAIEVFADEVKLGAYRIIEQGVINSIKHGPASEVSIQVSTSGIGEFTIEVSDNGPGAVSEKSGTGTVIIDAWVSILGGKKEIESEAGNGFTLRLTAPVKLGVQGF